MLSHQYQCVGEQIEGYRQAPPFIPHGELMAFEFIATILIG